MVPDEDFQRFNEILNEGEDVWEYVDHDENLSIYKKKDSVQNQVALRCQALLPKIPKGVAFKALTNLKIRKQWDKTLQNVEIIENDEDNGSAVIHYHIKTPTFMQTRDALISMKQLKNYPYDGALSLLHKSTAHTACPEDFRKCIRVDMHMYGVLFEDAPKIMGTKLSWVTFTDLKGSVPKSLLYQRSIRNPRHLVKDLTKACH